jgi:hypothetical protein
MSVDEVETLVNEARFEAADPKFKVSPRHVLFELEDTDRYRRTFPYTFASDGSHVAIVINDTYLSTKLGARCPRGCDEMGTYREEGRREELVLAKHNYSRCHGSSCKQNLLCHTCTDQRACIIDGHCVLRKECYRRIRVRSCHEVKPLPLYNIT